MKLTRNKRRFINRIYGATLLRLSTKLFVHPQHISYGTIWLLVVMAEELV
jgi:hypothetical protein